MFYQPWIRPADLLKIIYPSPAPAAPHYVVSRDPILLHNFCPVISAYLRVSHVTECLLKTSCERNGPIRKTSGSAYRPLINPASQPRPSGK